MRLVRHPNVVQLYEVMATKKKIYFVLEYVKGGELFNKVAKGRLKEDIVRKYFQQLIGAMEFFHSRGVYHCDLKLDNLLLDENGNLKVSDFGLSALAESKRRDGLLQTTCGTPAYVAPEVISRKGYDCVKAGIFSSGVILYVLLAGYIPFHDSNFIDLYRKIEKAEFKNWFPSVLKFLSKILDPNPNTRISTVEIMAHRWFKKGLDEREIISETPPPDVNATSCSNDTIKATVMNAFDIISLSAGFDLSGLFADPDHKKEARFTSTQPAAAIIMKLEDIAKQLKLKVQKEGGIIKMVGSKKGRKGVLAIDAEIFQVTPSFHLVEMKMTNGHIMEYVKLWKEDIGPALKDIVWAS